MKFSTIASSGLLLASSSVATPLAKRVAARQIRRGGRFTEAHINTGYESTNWAGAVLTSSGYTGVTTTFTVPNPQLPGGADQSTQYCATAWVGIDGDNNCSNAIAQAGIDFCITGSDVEFDAWYEWLEAPSTDFDNFGISAGDVITVTIDVSSTTTGSAVIDNTSTGQSVSHTWDQQPYPLCEVNAEWIVEDFTITENGVSSLAPFANFGSVTFSGNSATQNGQTVGIDGSDTIDLYNTIPNGVRYAQTTIDGENVIVTYTGP